MYHKRSQLVSELLGAGVPYPMKRGHGTRPKDTNEQRSAILADKVTIVQTMVSVMQQCHTTGELCGEKLNKHFYHLRGTTLSVIQSGN
jgi:hypothetical protein